MRIRRDMSCLTLKSSVPQRPGVHEAEQNFEDAYATGTVISSKQPLRAGDCEGQKGPSVAVPLSISPCYRPSLAQLRMSRLAPSRLAPRGSVPSRCRPLSHLACTNEIDLAEFAAIAS